MLKDGFHAEHGTTGEFMYDHLTALMDEYNDKLHKIKEEQVRVQETEPRGPQNTRMSCRVDHSIASWANIALLV